MSKMNLGCSFFVPYNMHPCVLHYQVFMPGDKDAACPIRRPGDKVSPWYCSRGVGTVRGTTASVVPDGVYFLSTLAPVLELTPSCLQSVRQYLTLQMNDYKGKYDYWQTRENFRQQILPIAQSAPGLCGGCNCGFMLYPTKITEESHSSMWTPTQFIAAPLLPLHNRRYVPDILPCQCGSNSRKFKHNKNVKTLSYIFMILR